MPTIKKRINLTVPEDIYQRLQEYKRRNGITRDAAACLQLVVQQMNAQESGEALRKAIQSMPIEQIQQIAAAGIGDIKLAVDAQLK